MKLWRVVLLLVLGLFTFGCLVNHPPILDGGSIQVNGYIAFWEADVFPLWLVIDDQLPPSHITATYSAAARWNDEVDIQVFEPVLWDLSVAAPRTFGFVVVSMRELGEDLQTRRILGLAHSHVYTGTGRMYFSEVWFDNDLDEDRLQIVMEHELGHTLTLAHDENDCRSLLHPRVTNCPPPIYIMPDDLDRIRLMTLGAYSSGTFAPQVRAYSFLPDTWQES